MISNNKMQMIMQHVPLIINVLIINYHNLDLIKSKLIIY